MEDQGKNLILATALSFLVILGWFVFFPPQEPVPEPTVLSGEDGDPILPQAGLLEATGVTPEPSRETPRIAIETPSLTGSIALVGGRIDDLSLSHYRETLDADAQIVRLLSPAGSENPYYTLHGWAPAGNLRYADMPGPSTPWELERGEILTPSTPVLLRWTSESGLTFRRRIAVDDRYMFEITQSVVNDGASNARLAPYGIVARQGEPDTQGFFILHEGVVRMSDGELEEIDYNDVGDLPFDGRESANMKAITIERDGWVGFTDKYWMMTLIPQPGQPFTSVAKYAEASDLFQTEARLPVFEVPPRGRADVTTMLFAGAKEWDAIRGYENDIGIDRFIDSIDWGWFFFLTKPIFILLHWINGQVGNMGWSIICLTFVIKAVLFPLAYKSYVSMARMKDLQPEMERIKEIAGDDRKRLQSEMMTLYREKKINPAAGCLPILPQIPIFFSLYKVIFVTIELRHAPFIFWIKDLSAPDPTSILNLFGALPWQTPDPGTLFAIISLGVLPILLGITMWLQQKLNPAPTDPTQAMVFAWLPWIFMFMLGQFASGLLLYWIANNTITFAQQYAIMRSQGVRPDVLGNIIEGLRKRRAARDEESQAKPTSNPAKPPRSTHGGGTAARKSPKRGGEKPRKAGKRPRRD